MPDRQAPWTIHWHFHCQLAVMKEKLLVSLICISMIAACLFVHFIINKWKQSGEEEATQTIESISSGRPEPAKTQRYEAMLSKKTAH